MKRLVCLLIVACFSGCSNDGSPAGPIESLSEARAAWEQSGSSDYSFDFERHCFCIPAAVEPVTIEVRGGEIAEVISRRTGAPIEPDPSIIWYTIEGLFGLIEEAEIEGGAPITVEYAETGYPRLIAIGSLAADAGIEYRVEEVQKLD